MNFFLLLGFLTLSLSLNLRDDIGEELKFDYYDYQALGDQFLLHFFTSTDANKLVNCLTNAPPIDTYFGWAANNFTRINVLNPKKVTQGIRILFLAYKKILTDISPCASSSPSMQKLITQLENIIAITVPEKLAVYVCDQGGKFKQDLLSFSSLWKKQSYRNCGDPIGDFLLNLAKI